MADTARSMEKEQLAAPGVIVIGMHRSGTSGVTRALHLMGLKIPEGDDLIGPTSDNRAGHFESRSLTGLNEELLLALDGTWSGPPPLPSRWETSDVVEPFLARAGDTFGAAYPKRRPWVWKDPRTSLTLPFWDRVLGRLPVVAVIRHPDEVAKSLAARNGYQHALGLALWSRYVRTMLAGVEGRPVFLVSWDRVLREPAVWEREVAEWLSDRLPVTLDPDAAAEAIDPSIRNERAEGAGDRPDPRLASEDIDLFERLRDLAGPSEAFRATEAGPEQAFVGPVIEERRRADLDLIDHRDAAAAERNTAHRYVQQLIDQLNHARDARERREAQRAEVEGYVRHLEEGIRKLQEKVRRLSEANQEFRRLPRLRRIGRAARQPPKS